MGIRNDFSTLMNQGNLYAPPPKDLTNESVEIVGEVSDTLKIERIVSRGHRSPPGFWYEQETDEWVVLLQGEATLRFENPKEEIFLKRGDWVLIPAGRRHRVEETIADTETVWLAVHCRGEIRTPS
jgi:cupin 2 domain-containing protein